METYIQVYTHTHRRVSAYHALSLKEIGAVPGGAFSAFWEPVYRMSISGSRRSRLCHMQVQSRIWMNLIFHHFLTLLVHKNGCCTKGGNCVDQEEAVMSAGGVTMSEMNDIMMLWCFFYTAVFCVCFGDRCRLNLTFCRCLQCHRLGDRDQQRTLHVWGKTARACVFLLPTKGSKTKVWYMNKIVNCVSKWCM